MDNVFATLCHSSDIGCGGCIVQGYSPICGFHVADFRDIKGSVCIELWRAVTTLAMFVVIDVEIVIVDPARVEIAMHEGNIGFYWIFQICPKKGTYRSNKGTLHFASLSQSCS